MASPIGERRVIRIYFNKPQHGYWDGALTRADITGEVLEGGYEGRHDLKKCLKWDSWDLNSYSHESFLGWNYCIKHLVLRLRRSFMENVQKVTLIGENDNEEILWKPKEQGGIA